MRVHPVLTISSLASLLFAVRASAGEAPHHEAHRAFDNPCGVHAQLGRSRAGRVAEACRTRRRARE
jgi:hypothetical protein